MGFVTRRVPAYEGVRRIVKLVLGGRPGSGSLDSVSSEHTMGRALPYLGALAAVGVASLGLGGLDWVAARRLPRPRPSPSSPITSSSARREALACAPRVTSSD